MSVFRRASRRALLAGCAAASLALLVPTVPAAGQAVDDRPLRPNVEAFAKRCENSRRGAIMNLEHKLRGLRAEGTRSAAASRTAAAIERDLRTLRSNVDPVVPSLSFPPEVGAIGRLPRLNCHVEQVLSSSEMIVRCTFPVKVTTVRHYQAQGEMVTQGVTFLVRGISTREASEGADFPMQQVLEITGKQTYKTDEGKLNTVWVLSEFDMKSIAPYLRTLSGAQK